MAIRTVVTRGYGNGTFNGTITDVTLRGYAIGVVVAVTPRTTTDFVIALPDLGVSSLAPPGVPFLLNEAGAILTREDGQPLINESLKATYSIDLPTMKVRRIR